VGPSTAGAFGFCNRKAGGEHPSKEKKEDRQRTKKRTRAVQVSGPTDLRPNPHRTAKAGGGDRGNSRAGGRRGQIVPDPTCRDLLRENKRDGGFYITVMGKQF